MKKLDLNLAAEEFEIINSETHLFYNTETGEFDYYTDFIDSEEDDNEKYEEDCWIAAPVQRDIGEYDMMAEFADAVTDPRVNKLLSAAIEGKGAFRRFKDTLHRLGLTDEWYAFKRNAFIDIARNWCDENDIPYEDKERMITYKLNRSNRKTLALYVRNGKVEVRAPLKASKRDIDKFVLSKEKWITDKLAESNERLQQRVAFTRDYGDMVMYRGKEYEIAAKPGGRVGFDDERFYMPPDLTPEQIKYACVQIYRMLAKRDLTNKVLDFAKQMEVTPIAVKINGAKTRWGSCSGKKSLNFSWQLIMAEDDVVDYVVVHELAHIKEMNHSKRFWTIVESVLPDYMQRRKRLKDLHKKLCVEDWE